MYYLVRVCVKNQHINICEHDTTRTPVNICEHVTTRTPVCYPALVFDFLVEQPIYLISVFKVHPMKLCEHLQLARLCGNMFMFFVFMS